MTSEEKRNEKRNIIFGISRRAVLPAADVKTKKHSTRRGK